MGLDPTHWSVPEAPVRAVRGYLLWPEQLPDHVARWTGRETAAGGGSREGTPPPAPTNEQGGRR